MTPKQALFVDAWKRLGSPALVATELGVGIRSVHEMRRRIESQGCVLENFNDQSSRAKTRVINHEGKVELEIGTGSVIVFSDAHYYPGIISTAHLGMLEVIKRIKPQAVICNGDAFDGSTISRHPRIGWDSKPTVAAELRAVGDRLDEVRLAAKKANGGCQLMFPLGNHDARYETFLAAAAPQYEGVKGFTLKDHFPHWKPCWSCWINDEVVVKHRWHNGIHATWNNTLKSGKTIVTGHLHQLKVTPFSDYNGLRYGVDSGTLADPYGPQFSDYTEGSPVNWWSGFVVLSFANGKLLEPETVRKWDEDHIQFRGQIIRVRSEAK
jgi:hypothetical protein